VARWNKRKIIAPREAGGEQQLKATLSWPHLLAMGVGAIVGTGILTLIGVGAGKAGPAVILSFVIAGLICACAALAYAEMATMYPGSGSAYTYTYAVIGELARQAPELAKFITEIRCSTDAKATVASQFPHLTPISIDYALMEKARRVLNIEATFDWDDVGSWISIAKYLPSSGIGNVSNQPITQIDSENNIVFNARKGTHVALLGVDDLIIVQTDDALLIANRHQADAIKNLSPLLPKELL
jgi:amino acid transporter